MVICQRKTLDLIVDTVKRLRYCDGVTDGDYKTTLKYFREQVTKVGEYTNRMRSCEGTALKYSFTENIYFIHSPVTIYKITGEISHNNIV
jgi:hypothetical protein